MTKRDSLHQINRVIGMLVVLIAAMFAAHATAREPLHDLAAFEHWVTDNLHCRADFMDEVQDQQFLDRAKALGVVVKTDWGRGRHARWRFHPAPGRS